jgi:hypothetical protein
MYDPCHKWRIRDYNELVHALNLRLRRSHKHAQMYMTITSRGILDNVMQVCNFACGSIAMLLVVCALVDEHMLDRVTMGGHPLLLCLTVTTTVFALTQAHHARGENDDTMAGTMSAHADTETMDMGHLTAVGTLSPEECMKAVAAHTHYFPARWERRCHTACVRRDFASMYTHRHTRMIRVVFDTLLCPFILCMCFVPRTRTILQFIRDSSVNVGSVGFVCNRSVRRDTNAPTVRAM